MNPRPDPRIVITGIGAVTNLGLDAASTWAGMREGRSGIVRIEGEAFSRYKDTWSVRIAGQVRDWDPTARIDPREAKRLDRFTQLGLYAAIEAVGHSGVDFTKENSERCGVVIGSGIGGIGTIEDGLIVMKDRAPDRLSPFTVPRLMVNAVAGNVSIRYGLRGPAGAHATACASSGHAVADAMEHMRRGRADVMVVGGAEAAVTPLCVAAFMTMKALSTRNDEPARASRPFDVDRDGFVLAEGAAMMVLETEAHARARGATILAEMVGYGNSSDAAHITAPDAEGMGARRAMQWALQDARLAPGQIDYINAHGTSTPLNDVAETLAIKRTFGEQAYNVPISSTKSMTGHLMGAGSLVEAVFSIKAMHDSWVPPTINLDNQDPQCDLNYTPHVGEERVLNTVMSNSFGFGGHNAVLILGKYQENGSR